MRWAAALLALAPAGAMAGTFCVSRTGSDANPGTAEAPFRTLARALQAAAASADGRDILQIAAGTYDEAGIDGPANVSAASWANMADPLIDGGWSADFSAKSGTTTFAPKSAAPSFDALSLSAPSTAARAIEIRDFEVLGAPGRGIAIVGAGQVTLTRVAVAGCASAGAEAENIAGFLAVSSTFDSNGGAGISVVATAGPVVLESCNFYTNARAFLLDQPSAFPFVDVRLANIDDAGNAQSASLDQVAALEIAETAEASLVVRRRLIERTVAGSARNSIVLTTDVATLDVEGGAAPLAAAYDHSNASESFDQIAVLSSGPQSLDILGLDSVSFGDSTVLDGLAATVATPSNACTITMSAGLESFAWNPRRGADTLSMRNLPSGLASINLSPGDGADSAEVRMGDGADSAIVGPAGGRIGSAMLAIDATLESLALRLMGGADRAAATPSATTAFALFGGAEGDDLQIDALNLPHTIGAGTFAAAGMQPISFAEFESVRVLGRATVWSVDGE